MLYICHVFACRNVGLPYLFFAYCIFLVTGLMYIIM